MPQENNWTLTGFKYRPQMLTTVEAQQVGKLMVSTLPAWMARAISSGQVRLCQNGGMEFVEIIRLGAPPIIVREGDYIVHHGGAYAYMPAAMFDALFTTEQKVIH